MANGDVYQITSEYYVNASGRQVGGSYYKDMPVQPWDVVDGWSVDEQIAVYRHGALKYLMRMGTKDERIQEIEKAKHYIEKLLEVLYEANLPSNSV